MKAALIMSFLCASLLMSACGKDNKKSQNNPSSNLPDPSVNSESTELHAYQDALMHTFNTKNLLWFYISFDKPKSYQEALEVCIHRVHWNLPNMEQRNELAVAAKKWTEKIRNESGGSSLYDMPIDSTHLLDQEAEPAKHSVLCVKELDSEV